MKEFIFTWSVENISYFWRTENEEIISPPFVADTLYNTAWKLRLYTVNYFRDQWISLALVRGKDDYSFQFTFDFEFSCISANGLVLTSRVYPLVKSHLGIGDTFALKTQDLFQRKRSLYIPQDKLTVRCRLWKREIGVDKFGQCLGYTRLEIEKILVVQDMNTRINKEDTVFIHAKQENKLLISIDVSQEKDGLKIEVQPVNTEQIMFSTFKFSAEGRKKKQSKYEVTWIGKPCLEVWKSSTLSSGNKSTVGNKLKLRCEFIYATGKETKWIEQVNSCSYKFPEFSSNSILSCITSGELSGCRSICKDLWDLYEKQILCDVELKTETTSYFAHKTVLCARSPVFLAMFTHNMKERLTYCVEIEDLEDDTLQKFLQFLYTDIFEGSRWKTVMKLYYAADKYRVTLLKNLCISYFMDRIDDNNVSDLLMLADRHNDSYLKWKAENYFRRMRKRISGTSKWKQLIDKEALLAAENRRSGNTKTKKIENVTKPLKLTSCPNATGDFIALYHSCKFSDIVIQTTTATFPAHKIILCACSSKLREMITSDEFAETLKMEDLKEDTVSHLLQFLYADSLGDINLQTVTKLYHAAVIYDIERLKIKCSCFFVENFDPFNVSILLQLAHEHEDVKLKSLAEDFISLLDLSELDETGVSKRMETRRSKRLRLETDSKDK